MKEVLSQLSERYDLVVIDTAPLGVVSDAYPLGAGGHFRSRAFL